MHGLILLVLYSVALFSLAQSQRVVTVAKDGSGDFKSVSAAVNSIRSQDATTTIKIGSGVYYERVHVTSAMKQVIFLGSGATNTLIVYDVAGANVGTFSSWTVLVEADNFIAENIAFANNASGYDHSKAGQSVALDIRGDKATIRSARILGAQDTLYTGNKRVYVSQTYINGSVDSIFGIGSAVFEGCVIEITSYVTAHQGDNVTHSKYLIANSTIQGPSNRPYTAHSTYLGRPWRCYAWVIYKNCYLGDLISPVGWFDWDKGPSCTVTVNYDEYKSTGPGADPSKRVAWSHQLTASEADKYTVGNVLGGWVPPKPVTSQIERVD